VGMGDPGHLRAGRAAGVVGSGVPKTSAARVRTPSTSPSPGLPPELAASLARWEQGRDVEALIEAGKLYGSDIEAETNAVAAGTHPVQRREEERRRRAQR
jgi:hypothetical protein